VFVCDKKINEAILIIILLAETHQGEPYSEIEAALSRFRRNQELMDDLLLPMPSGKARIEYLLV